MPPTDSELKFHKMAIENWVLIGFSLDRLHWESAVITTTLCSIANGEI